MEISSGVFCCTDFYANFKALRYAEQRVQVIKYAEQCTTFLGEVSMETSKVLLKDII